MLSTSEIAAIEKRLSDAFVQRRKARAGDATLIEIIDEFKIWPVPFNQLGPIDTANTFEQLFKRAPNLICAIAAETGFRFEGVRTEFWAKFEGYLGQSVSNSQRQSMGIKFSELASAYSLIRPSESQFTEHFSIIAWPIANALLPIDLIGPVTRLLARAPVGSLPSDGGIPNFSSLRAWQAVSRDRVLTNNELKRILARARADESAFSRIVRLLLFTGQRGNEIASPRAEWIDFKSRTITLPPQITKNKRQHTFPFGKMAGAVLKAAMIRTEDQKEDEKKKGEPKLLFAARGWDTAFAGWSKAKPAFDSGCPLPHWTLHDLRRTCATDLAALGVPVHVTEKLLNHVSGTTGGIVAVYERHAYLDEMREAIEAREKFIRSLDGRNSSNRRRNARPRARN